MENMGIYNAVRAVPDNAKKPISAGRLRGMTDINPMWRIQALTNQFGPCGLGWKYVIKDKRMENGANGEIAAFVDIDLYYKVDGEWSEAVPGTGGASFVAKEKNGLYVSDECVKMALTDALSVAFKALGGGADVYWAAGQTKYTQTGSERPETQGEKPKFERVKPLCDKCGKPIRPISKNGELFKTAEQLIEYTKRTYGLNLCHNCMREAANEGA